MKKRQQMMRLTLYIFIGILLSSCSNQTQTSTEKEQTNEVSFQLPDSLFAFQDIKSSLFVKQFWYDRDNNFQLYSDSSRKISFVKLDTIQMRKLIAPVVTSEMTMIDANYVTNWMEGRFISKQKNIGEFLPIIVLVSGDDYEALFFILLDKSYNPISHYRMYGGFNGGPSEGPDSTLELSPVIHTFIRGNEFASYSLTEFMRPDSIARLSIIDSVNYIGKILPTGQIEVTKLDSTRYERMPD
jgi:hypothetical protein